MAAIKANYMTAEEAVKLIKSHDRVYIQGSTSIPEVLLDALTARGHELEGVEMYSAFAIGRRDAPYAVHVACSLQTVCEMPLPAVRRRRYLASWDRFRVSSVKESFRWMCLCSMYPHPMMKATAVLAYQQTWPCRLWSAPRY